MEQAIISGIAHDTSEARISLVGLPDTPGIAARVFRPLADAGMNIDMIVQNDSGDGRSDISFTLPKEDLERATPLLEATVEAVGARVATDPEIAKVSLVGAGMKANPGVAADMFEALADAGINIEVISTSSIRISCLVRAFEVERAVQVIHDRFRLSDEVVLREQHPATATDQLRALRSTKAEA
jgi:aspartate kinase